MFLAKYRDILLIKDNTTMIVTDAAFNTVQNVWKLVAKRALRNICDDREHLPDPNDKDGTAVDMSGRKDAAGGLARLLAA